MENYMKCLKKRNYELIDIIKIIDKANIYMC